MRVHPGYLALGPALAAAWAVTYSEGPPPGHTGGFGEPTCHACHFENAPNDPAGSVELIGLPARFAPGAAYDLLLRLEHPELRRAGFQLAARYASGPEEGENAGRLEAGEGLRLVPHLDRPAAYLQHTLRGSDATNPGAHSWAFRWIAPLDSAGAVTFHVAANAANDNQSEFGDRIYTLEVTVPSRAVP